jgi:hypothetical protein
MSRDNRYVFDTNVIVSALLFNDSVPGQAFFRALDRGVLAISPQLVEQLRDVLSRDKFDVGLSDTADDRFDTRMPDWAGVLCRKSWRNMEIMHFFLPGPGTAWRM